MLRFQVRDISELMWTHLYSAAWASGIVWVSGAHRLFIKKQVFWVPRSNVAEPFIEATLRFAPHCLIIFVKGNIMSLQQWRVSYKSREGNLENTIIEWPGKPSIENAAVRIREHLLGESYLLVDTPRDHPEPTVFLLQSYGFQITSIEEVAE